MILIEQLKKSYGTGAKKVEILKGINLTVHAGEFVSLLGSSGSGKTTLLRCIAGLEKPDSGKIQLDQTLFSDSSKFLGPEHRRLGMVFQNYAVWPHMTIEENVAFSFRVKRRGRLSDSEINHKVQETLDLVKLGKLAKRYPSELSGGQQQRVALARALAMSPQALLLDEPLSNLDAVLREELGVLVRTVQQELKLTTILVTHDRREALSLSDRIVVLNQGQVEAIGAPEELYLKPPTPFVAELLSGGQVLTQTSIGGSKDVVLLPRRWMIASGGDPTQVASRIFLGNEYEYTGSVHGFSDKIRFFANEKFEVGSQVSLKYNH